MENPAEILKHVTAPVPLSGLTLLVLAGLIPLAEWTRSQPRYGLTLRCFEGGQRFVFRARVTSRRTRTAR